MFVGVIYASQICDSHLWIFSVHPGTDMHIYVTQAFGIATGKWPDAAPFYRAPLYPYFLRMLLPLRLYGCCMIQALLYGCGASMVMASSRLLAGRTAGWIAAGLLLLYGGGFYFTGVLHSTVLELFLSSACLLLILSWQRLEGRGLWGIAAATGVAYGLLCLIRPNYFACAPFLGLGFLLAAPDARARKRLLIRGMATAVAAFLVILPAVIHSNRYSEKPVFMTTNGARTFWIGNSENSPVFGFCDTSHAKRLSVVSFRFWTHQMKKAVGFWWSGEAPQNVNFYLFRDTAPVLWLLIIPFGAIGSLFLVSTWYTRREWRKLWPCHAMFWPYYLSIVAFFIVGRFRVPALPPMLILGSVGIVQLLDRRKQLQAAAVAFGILTFCSVPWARTVNVSDLYSSGMAAMLVDHPGMAEAFFKDGFDREPDWGCGIQQAVAFSAIGRHQDAAAAVGKLSKVFPDKIDLAETMAACFDRAGQKDQAAKIRAAFAAQNIGKDGNDLVQQGLVYFQMERQRYDQRLTLRQLAERSWANRKNR